MNQLYQRIVQNLDCLPPKDKTLCEKFIKLRDFRSLLEIVKSCLIMKKRDDRKEVHKDKWVNVDRDTLEQLNLDVIDYISYLNSIGISDEIDDDY